jgi:hypothetical protein
MLKPWRPCEPCDLEPVDLDELPDPDRSILMSHTIEAVSIGFVAAGDYRIIWGDGSPDDRQTVRYFQSADGAVLGWFADRPGSTATRGFASLLQDGTCVKSIPEHPFAPWSCCRFPVYVNFGAGCSLEDLLVLHLTSLAELEHGCGPTLKYAASQVPEIVAYMLALEHETEHGLGAPPEALPEIPEPVASELIAH